MSEGAGEDEDCQDTVSTGHPSSEDELLEDPVGGKSSKSVT